MDMRRVSPLGSYPGKSGMAMLYLGKSGTYSGKAENENLLRDHTNPMRKR